MCSSVSHSEFSDSWVDLSARKKMQGLALWSLEVVEFEILTAQRSTVWHRQYIERSWGQEMTRPFARLEGEDNTHSLVHTLVHPCFFLCCEIGQIDTIRALHAILLICWIQHFFWQHFDKKLRLQSFSFSGLFWPCPLFPTFRLWIPKAV